MHKARSGALAGMLALGLGGMVMVWDHGLVGQRRAPAPTQVIAYVNKQAVTHSQLALILKRAEILAPTPAQRRGYVDKLVDRELAVQAALEAKLDRDPQVVLQLDEARRDVLARAWAERVAAEGDRPSENQMARFYSLHPELFAQRKIYKLREMALPSDLPSLPEAKTMLTRGASLDTVSSWLRQRGAKFNDQQLIRAAEQLPLEALPKLHQAAPGQTVVFESSNGVLIYELQSSVDSPVPWPQANALIRPYLAKQAGRRAVDAELNILRANALIRSPGG